VETKPPVSNGNETSENNVVSDQQDSTSINEPVDITKVLKPIPMDESTDSNENEEEIKVATPIKKKTVKKTAVSKK